MLVGARTGPFGQFGCGRISNETSAEGVIRLLPQAKCCTDMTLIALYSESGRWIHRIHAVAITLAGSQPLRESPMDCLVRRAFRTEHKGSIPFLSKPVTEPVKLMRTSQEHVHHSCGREP